ncbi:MAG: hypothetical protein Q8O76_11515, partial [Chloroflexota bacterium]|nr:hypothetical protein [Chloroflexota bacterium]
MAKTNITIGVGLLAALSVVVLVAACSPAPTAIPTPTTTVYLPPQTLPATVTPSPTEEAEIIPIVVEERQLTYFATMREGQITEESGAAFHPAWSPDGKQIAFDLTEEIEGLTRETIWVMRSDGSQSQRLLTPPDFGYARDVAWSPDGERLAFYLGGAEGIDIWVCKADGSGLKRLVTSADP